SHGPLSECPELRGIDEGFREGFSKRRTAVIAISKGAAPLGLISAGEEHVEELCAAYDADPELYRRGKRMAIRRSIYASDVVKAQLEASHHGKCCYCETLIPKPYAHSHVEHWRPKSSSRQGR